MILRRLSLTALLLALTGNAFAGVLPDDRSDVLYHLYDGGGVQIEAELALDPQNILADDGSKVAGLREKTEINLADGQWWWD